jgi:hypothetical protein
MKGNPVLLNDKSLETILTKPAEIRSILLWNKFC